MPDPACPANGLAMKQAMRPWRAATPRIGALEQDRVVDGTQRVGTVLERDLELAGGVLRHQRADRQAELARSGVELVEQRRHLVEPAEAVGVDAGAAFAAEHAGGRLEPPVGGSFEQVELEFDRDHGREARRLAATHDPRQGVARIGRGRPAVQFEHRAEDLPGGPVEPGRTAERAGNRPAALVGVADGPDQPGAFDVLAGDVETEDRARHVAAGRVQRGQFLAGDVLAATDAAGVGDDELDGFDVRIGVEECLRFGRRAETARDFVWMAHERCRIVGGAAAQP